MNTKKPVSERKLAANRANAKKSTGPRTPQGKRRSSLNALTHGLTAKDITVLGESYDQFPAIRDALIQYWQPANAQELLLVERIAIHQVRFYRMIRQETGTLDLKIPDVTADNTPETINSAIAMAHIEYQNTLNLFSRYLAQIERGMDNAIKLLLQLRKGKGPADSETKPTFVENKEREIGKNENHRFELDAPMQPEEAKNRRTGKLIPYPETPKPTRVLVWVDENGNEWMRTDNKPLKQADGSYIDPIQLAGYTEEELERHRKMDPEDFAA
jgi:hypothetical protein